MKMGLWLKAAALASALGTVALPAAAEQVRLTFLHVNDIYEYKPVGGKGGLAELLTLVDAERAKAPKALFSFGGDLFSPSLLSGITGGGHMVEFLNEMGVDVATLGNHEFDQGPDNAAKQMALAKFPWVVSNVTDGGKPFANAVPTSIVTIDGVKIGLLGILTTSTKNLSSLGTVEIAPEVAATRAATEALRAQGADVVVALTHVDLALDRQIAREVKGIDLILGGHDHDAMTLAEGGPLVVKAGADGHYLSVVEMVVDRPDAGKQGKTSVYPAAWRLASTIGAAPHAKLQPLVAKYDALLDDTLGQQVATLTTTLTSKTDTVRSGEAAIGNFMADALRAYFKADLALMNGGGIRGNREYAAGTVLTKRDLRTEFPFNNTAVLLSVTGAQFRAALESGLSQVDKKAGRFPHIAGAELVYDPTKPAGQRVVSLTIGGQPLDPVKEYKLATIDYLAKGGDGYSVLKDARFLIDPATGPHYANVAIDYAAAAAVLKPVVEGRVKVVP